MSLGSGRRRGKSNSQVGPGNANAASNRTASGPYGKVLRQYRVYWKTPQTAIRPVLLQFPSRDPSQPYSRATNQKPLELRIKPRSGIVEIDIPLSLDQGYDKDKGLLYGTALRKSKVLQAGGDYGLAGGFGISKSGPNAKKEDEEVNDGENEDFAEGYHENDEDEEGSVDDEYDEDHEYYYENFEEARERGFVMDRLTLAGQFHVQQDGDPVMAFGTIRGNEIHLLKCDIICTLTPKLDHVDALHDLQKSRSRSKRQAAAAQVNGDSEPRAVNMAIKSTDEEDQLELSEIAKVLKDIAEEPWQRMLWVDQGDHQAFRFRDKHMMVHEPEKGINLVSALTPRQYVDAVSAPRMDPATGLSQPMMTGAEEWPASTDGEESSEEEMEGDEEDIQEAGEGDEQHD